MRALPADDTDEHGFDNVAEVLTVSPALMERTLRPAKSAAPLALTGPGVELYQLPRMLTQDDRLSDEPVRICAAARRCVTTSRRMPNTSSRSS